MQNGTAVIGAVGEDGSSKGVGGNQADNSGFATGAAFVLSRNGSTWSYDEYLKAFDFVAGVNHDIGYFGNSVGIDGDRIVVGEYRSGLTPAGVNGAIGIKPSWWSDEYAGAAYVFERTGGLWATVARLAAPYPRVGAGGFALQGNQFGHSVGMSEDYVIAGAPGEDGSGVGINPAFVEGSSESGSAFVFDLAATCGVFRYGDYVGAQVLDIYSGTRPVSGSSFRLELYFGSQPKSGIGGLIVSAAPALITALGGVLLVDPALSIYGPGIAFPVDVSFPNKGVVDFVIPPGLAGLSFFAQFVVAHPSLPGGWAFTNGLRVTVCP